jgi:protein-disulfide isomerase
MRLKTICAAMLLLATACDSKPKEVAAPDSVDRQTKEEIWAIMKEGLLKEPEVLVEAFGELERRETEAAFARLTAHDNDPSIGPKDAPITIVEFFDYKCPYCKAANDWLFKQADNRNGQVRVIFKEFPILSEDSIAMARAGLAANRQGKYRDMHIALIKGGDTSAAGIEKTARSVGLNMERWKRDIADPKIEEMIQRVHREAAEAGIEATPGFFINGQTYQGFHEPKLEEMMKTAREKLKS